MSSGSLHQGLRFVPSLIVRQAVTIGMRMARVRYSFTWRGELWHDVPGLCHSLFLVLLRLSCLGRLGGFRGEKLGSLEGADRPLCLGWKGVGCSTLRGTPLFFRMHSANQLMSSPVHTFCEISSPVMTMSCVTHGRVAASFDRLTGVTITFVGCTGRRE